MPQTLFFTLRSYDLTAGTNTTNPMGNVIRMFAFNTAGDQEFRLHMFMDDVDQPTKLGFRASDNAFAYFLQRRDFASYVLMLDQAKATHIKVDIGDDNDSLLGLEIATIPFQTIENLKSVDLAALELRS